MSLWTRRRFLGSAVAGGVALMGAPGLMPKARKTFPFSGTLRTDPAKAAQEFGAGLGVAEVDIGWDIYEQADGVFDSGYAAQINSKVQAYRSAGLKVVLGLALHYPPAWVFNYPNSRFANQFGGVAGEVNLVFNQTLRQKAEALIARINADIGLSNFYAVRVTSGGGAECMYPDEWADGVRGNGYWAYDANAQVACPFPGWRPGESSLTIAQVQQWYDWYLGSLVGAVNWQIQTYKNLGYTGLFQVLTPGLGSRPNEYTAAINARLDGTGDGNLTMGRGAVWHKFYDALPDKSRVVAYCSSMADWSGNPVNNLAQAGDSTVALTDPQIESWSASRWIAYNANRWSLPKSGENPGGGSHYGLAMMQAAAQQMKACVMTGMFWAFDANLYDGVSGVTLTDYTNALRA